MSSIAEWFVGRGATPAKRDHLLSADINFFALGVGDFHLAQVAAQHIRAGLFDQDIDCHSVSSRIYALKQSKCYAYDVQPSPVSMRDCLPNSCVRRDSP